uniref:Uncharacterized protein LOC102803232 n=1 Tax=Saccoglossus kowalevskii TaxID=10224 RepID=A0ABM0MJZ2_SACKO|nr:PREDICTED: uncharacterized protein LOC102803232 [Saccoglossus kowalevskii]
MGFLRCLWIGSTTLRCVRKPDRISFAYYHDNQSSEPINKQQQKKGMWNTESNHKKLHIDTKDMDSCSVYDILCASIVPRPIAFVSTCSLKDKVNNLAAFSFFMPVTSVPPTLAFSITR